MALPAKAKVHTAGAVGDTISGMDPEPSEISGAGLIFRHYCEPWNPHLLHDWFTDTVLVWIYQFGSGVSRAGFSFMWTFLNLFTGWSMSLRQECSSAGL